MSNLSAGRLVIPYARMARKKITRFTGPQGRIDLLRKNLTSLVREERIELPDFVGYESRQYAERLIDLAKKYGDRHVGMMEMADYWLLEKDLIPKLFKVLAKRYENSMGPYTQVHKLPFEYPTGFSRNIILELKDNPYPPVLNNKRDNSKSLSNLLISALKQDKYRN